MRLARHRVTTAIVALAHGTWAWAQPTVVGQPEIHVRVAYEGTRGHLLRVELENRSPYSIRMTNSFLPWGSTFSMMLVATVAMDQIGPEIVIERNKVQEHPIGTEISIGPDEILRGTIDLDWQFPQLREWLVRGDVVVFWSYLPPLRDGHKAKRCGGFIVVAEQGRAETGAKSR